MTIVFFIIGCWLLLIYAGYRWEKRRWNDGVCRHCGGQMKWFSTASYGSRGYMCEHDYWDRSPDHPHECVWISYQSVDRKKEARSQ